MTDAAQAHALPEDGVSPADWRMFRQLTVQAAEGSPVNHLLNVLAEHLGAKAIVLVRPEDRPPDMQRVIVIALQWQDTRLGDLYAALSDQPDSIAAAARLAFYAPVIALCAAVDR